MITFCDHCGRCSRDHDLSVKHNNLTTSKTLLPCPVQDCPAAELQILRFAQNDILSLRVTFCCGLVLVSNGILILPSGLP